MSSLGHMSPSLLGKIKAGLRPRPLKVTASRPSSMTQGTKPTPNTAQSSQADIAKNKVAEQEDVEERVAWGFWLRRNLPGWLVSMLTHVVLLLVLALMTLSIPEEPKQTGLVVSTAPNEALDTEEILDDLELDATEEPLEENLEPSELTDISAVEISEPGTLGEAPNLEPLDTNFAAGPLLGKAIEWEELGSPLGENKRGDGKDGLGPPISFFGVKTQGRRFMFVVDNSNSMNKGRFETAVAELTKSVDKLTPNQEFYIVFYSDTAYPLFYPQSAKTWVKATPQNKAKLRSWLAGVHRCLWTNGREAFELAFSMKPDVMYLLGDGAFNDNPIPDVLATRNDKLVIHTLGFALKKGREDFEAVAAKFKGKFHDVEVTPEMVQLSKQVNRPANKKLNGVWGLKLGELRMNLNKANK